MFVNIFKVSLVSAILLVFIGCHRVDDTNTTTTVNSVSIASCNDAFETWTSIDTNNTVDAEADSQLKFDYDSEENKKVCLLAGTATVQR